MDDSRTGQQIKLPDGRTISNWPEDVVELAGALVIDAFSVLGVSGIGRQVGPGRAGI